MERIEIASIHTKPEAYLGRNVTVCGWARTIRDSKAVGFMEINDGSCFTGLQVVLEDGVVENYKTVIKQKVGCSMIVNGTLVATPEAKQPYEIHAVTVEVEGPSTPDYPMQQ